MPSSTSSFKSYELKRVIPRHPWFKLALMSLVLTGIATALWEYSCRQMQYAPVLNDTKDLWASRRALVDLEPERTVLIGSSRMLFDIDLNEFSKVAGDRPLQLATVGTNPGPYLEDLANHPEYSGTVIVGVVPSLFFAPGGPPMKSPLNHLKRFREWSPTEKIGHYLAMTLESRLAFLNEGDLTLKKLLKKIKLPNREKVKIPPELPPYFHEVDHERQGGMTEFAANDVSIQKRIQQIWLPLFTPPPGKKGETQEEKDKGRIKNVASVIEKTKQRVKRLRQKGGRVIFVRLPSTGELREIENKYTPRKDYWDRILEETGSPGVHFEDHAELSGFDCPEWSHLNRQDAIEFTRRLMPLLKKHLE